jgi:two-component system OmpR family response regulator
MIMRLLLVEDDTRLAEELSKSLRHNAYAVTHVASARDALNSLASNEFALMILDLGLPDMDGIDLLKIAKKKHLNLAIIILTARDTTTDKIDGLDAGADDYLAKPFDIEELLARLRAMERRFGTASSSLIEIGDVCLDIASHELDVNGNKIELPRREFMLLKALMENHGRIQNKQHLEQTLYEWGEEVSSNAIEVHIHNLRKRLPDKFIKTIRGVGYSVPKQAK